jgi:dipeptidyl aminopeptidase/acylaminoacyl peptidase
MRSSQGRLPRERSNPEISEESNVFKRPIFAAAILGLFALASVADADVKPVAPTIAQMSAFPKMSGFTVSPDGAHIAALEARGEDRVILVWKTDALTTAPTVIASQSMKIQAVDFVKNDVLGVSLWQPYDLKIESTTKTFIGKFYLTDLQGKNWRDPLPLPRPRTSVEETEQSLSNPTLLDPLVNDPNHILVVNNVGVNAGDVYKVNIRTARAERVQRSDAAVAGYVTDLNGDLRSRNRLSSDSAGTYVATEFRSGSGWAEHFRSYVKDRDIVDVIGFSKDPNIAFVASNRGRDKVAIYEYNVDQRALGDIAFEHKYFDAAAASVWGYKDENFGEIVSFTYSGPRSTSVVNAPRFRQIDASIRAALNINPQSQTFVDPASGERTAAPYDVSRYYRIISSSADLNVIIIGVGGPDEPASYYLLRNKSQLSLLSREFPDIDARAFGTTTLVYYKARDGLDIPAFLTKPNVDMCGPGPWPTVIHPHGGPWARDDLTFDNSMWVPLLASRCRAVLRPQFRGSADGWGRRLWVAGDAEWGQKMQDDKDDGAKWMIENRLAAPGRIAMFGFSYGGYSAFAAAVRPNGLYKCAIAGAGVSDINRIWSRFYRNQFFRDGQAKTVAGLNPLDRADAIQIPIMVYHGVRDQTVPIEQSDWFVARARRSGQDVQYFKFDDYGHGPAWTREIFGNQLRAIDTYLREGCAGGL